MGLFGQKEPCAICGGKVKAIFPWKVDGQLVCNDCYGMVDVPEEVLKNMSLDDFCAYRAFREENAKLKDQFQVSKQIDFGWFDTKFMFDFKHNLLCMDKHLGKTIFEGSQIKSFMIKQDESPLIQGSARGMRHHPSNVPSRVRAMAPQIDQYRMQAEMERERERRDPDYHSRLMFNIPEPFKNFVITIKFDHPYWTTFKADMGAPSFDNSYPDVNTYLDRYHSNVKLMEELATSIKRIAFPDAPELTGDAGASKGVKNGNAAAKQVDPITEIKRYKELLDQGLITEEEFTAKKRKLMKI